ncbi:MAG TPA: tRNA pseudouridine(38-40) synthase TruA [Ktedonobacterales bacterium]|nr:tRNA pseudouridine(38-40) synthase TruA [Ktedonobacterales bacterium]
MNVAALVEYDGTRYSGFQRQPVDRGPTIQGEIEAALRRVTGAPVQITGAGRTDSGVHATGQVVSFQPGARLDEDAWRRALNAHLPRDIAVRAVRMVGDGFHARKSALGRRYRYRIFHDPIRSPLRERYAWRASRPLDVATMRAAAALLPGERDFGAFGSSPRDSREDGYRGHTVRRLTLARCEETESGEIVFDFAANAFLTGMVRRLVGTLALVGAGRLTVDGLRDILEARDRARAGPAAPPHGLCFTRVDYPAEWGLWGDDSGDQASETPQLASGAVS